MLYTGADASTPGNPLPVGTKILAAYIGARDLPSPPDTPHIWSEQEWNLYLDPDSHLYGGPDLRALPIFVHDFVSDPVTIAQNMVDAAIDLGWKSVGLQRVIMFDTEILVNRAFVHEVDLEVTRLGFRMGNYGSYEFVIQNGPVSGGIWPALLTSRQPRILPANCDGQQWKFGLQWDLDIFNQFVYDHCGQGMRHSAV